MKRLLFVVAVLLELTITGCAREDVDPYQVFRNKTEWNYLIPAKKH